LVRRRGFGRLHADAEQPPLAFDVLEQEVELDLPRARMGNRPVSRTMPLPSSAGCLVSCGAAAAQERRGKGNDDQPCP
jgi:hypothetical protein